MKRTPLTRKTPLKAKKPLQQSRTPLKRTPMKASKRTRARKAEEGQALSEARYLVFRRANGKCEARWDGCSGKAEHAHHRQLRSQGGRHTVDNLLAVCFLCHNQIHQNPSLAYDRGHMLKGNRHDND